MVNLKTDRYSPWDLLPAEEPRTVRPKDGYFYEKVAKHLIIDTVRIMNNGVAIDLNKVQELEAELKRIITEVETKAANHPYIQKYLEEANKRAIETYKLNMGSKKKPIEHFISPFKYSNMVHRSYFMYVYCKHTGKGCDINTEEIAEGVHKWPANTVKKLAKENRVLQKLLKGELNDSNSIVQEAMLKLAKDKQRIYNSKYDEKITNPVVEKVKFNFRSPKQKQELFTMLGVKAEKVSAKTGEPTYDRAAIESIRNTSTDPLIVELCDLFIDYSFAAIIESNFVPAFYKYSVDGRLYGQYKLLGAKSARYTSSNPNMLNAPSTGSRFAKPVKECFRAPEGFIVASIDYAALEDRIVANLSRDTNKLAVFLEGVDGHSLAATYYFKDEVEKLIGHSITDHKEAAKELKHLVDNKDSKAKALRQRSKPVSLTTKRLHTVMYVE